MLVGFYGRTGPNCFKSLGLIVLKISGEDQQRVADSQFNFKSERKGIESLTSNESTIHGSTQSSSVEKSDKQKLRQKKAKKDQPACGQEEWQSFLKDIVKKDDKDE